MPQGYMMMFIVLMGGSEAESLGTTATNTFFIVPAPNDR